MSGLESWHNLIEKLGEEDRRREEAQLAELQRQYPEQVERIKALPNEELLDHFRAYSQHRFPDPRQTKIFQDLAEEARAELLRRLG